MTRHIHAEVLARYRSGDLSERRSRRIGAHLAGCHRCAAASSGLDEVSHLLRAAAAPPMPAGITARIEAALAAEAAQPSRAAAQDGPLAAAGTGRGLGGARHSGSGPGRAGGGGRAGSAGRSGWPTLRSPVALRVLAGAAAAAVIVGGAYTAGQLTSGGGSASTASGASAARPDAGNSSDAPNIATPGATGAAPESRPAGSGARNAAGSSAAAEPTLTYRAAHGVATFVPVAGGAKFGRQELASQVGGLLSGRQKTPPGIPSGASTPRFFSGIPVTTLEGCVSRVAAGGRVRLVDVGRYQGSKATIIVVAPAAGGRQQIWVVGPGCSGSDRQVIARATLPSAG